MMGKEVTHDVKSVRALLNNSNWETIQINVYQPNICTIAAKWNTVLQ